MDNIKLDKIQLQMQRNKFLRILDVVSVAYKSHSVQDDLLNEGIAFKLSNCYFGLDGYFIGEREEIARKLNQINFIHFFYSQEKREIDDKKIFFHLKSPQRFLDQKSLAPTFFIKYVTKKYLATMSSFKLNEIYHKSVPIKLSITQNILRQTIYEIVSIKGTLTNRIASIFENAETREDIKWAAILKKNMDSAQPIILFNDNSICKYKNFAISKSVCRKYD